MGSGEEVDKKLRWGDRGAIKNVMRATKNIYISIFVCDFPWKWGGWQKGGIK